MSEDRLVSALVHLIGRVQADELGFVAGLSPEERAAEGTLERWTAKDLVAHIGYWHAHLASLVARALAGQPPPDPYDDDEVNARIYQTYRASSWDEVLAQSRDAYARLLDLLPQFTGEQLLDPNFVPGRNRALGRTVLGSGYWHPEMHLSDWYVEHGRLAVATDLQRDMLSATGELEGLLPDVRGESLYNLACFYAKTGQRTEALANLREALALAPNLVAWSREDADLASLHGDPDYEALYHTA